MINRLLVADSVTRISAFAIAIRKFPTHTHAGVLYVSQKKGDDQGKLLLLHLGGPGAIAREVWTPDWGWAAPQALLREELLQLAVLCDYVVEANEQIPYGFKFSSATRFIRDGKLQLADGCHGLTCSTFALALFGCFDIALLDLASWQIKGEDAAWIQRLATYWNDPAIAAEAPCRRYRPEEVIAGCLSDTTPLTHDDAQPLAQQVIEKMEGFIARKRSGI